jgi:serine/threonine-protein kinase
MKRDDESGTDPTLVAAAVAETAQEPRDTAIAATGVPVDADTIVGTQSPPTQPSNAGRPSTSQLQRYRIGDVIGRGGMGEVVSAHDEQIDRPVALKRMHRPVTSNAAIARFMREAKIQGRLEHPAVVPVHELWRDEHGVPFFVMKKLAGETLQDVLGLLAIEDPPAVAKYTRTRLLRAFTEVCLAIEFAHKERVVHRDLKPANIMLGDFGEVYVLDWGIARVLGQDDDIAAENKPTSGPDVVTVAGTMMGTPGYMSPEQVRGDADLDGRADIYALGCILFEILTGEPLHPRRGAVESAVVGIDARPSVRTPSRDIPPELDAACVAATNVDRDKRPKSARSLGDLVQAYLDGDRDVALRKTLAKSELETAVAQLARGIEASGQYRGGRGGERQNAVAAYRAAMQAGARALALDPTSREAAELVGRLMLEPPATVPDEVEREVAAIEEESVSSQAQLGVRAMIGYLVFFPVIFAGGLRDTWHVLGGPALVATLMLITHAISKRPTRALVYLSFAGNVLLIAMFARVLTPLLVAPGVALVTVMIYASHPRLGNGWMYCALAAAGVLVPLAMEGLRLVATTTTVEGARIVMQLPAERLDPTVALVGLGAYVAVILSMATLLVRLQALKQRTMQRNLQLQAWQLRQLVPPKAEPVSLVKAARSLSSD